MKIEHILYEDHKKVNNDWIKKNCSEALERHEKGYSIYRGDNYSDISKHEGAVMTPLKTPREAAHASSNLHNDIINKSNRFKSFPERKIIMTNNKERANSYGFLYLALPLNGARIGILSEEDIFDSFNNIPNDLDLEDFYSILRKHFLIHVRNITDSDFWDMESSNKVFKDIKNNASNEFLNTLFEKITENKELKLYGLGDILVQCIKDGNAQKLFEIFTPEGWDVKNISKFDVLDDREVWTDSPVVLVRMKSDEEEDEEDEDPS